MKGVKTVTRVEKLGDPHTSRQVGIYNQGAEGYGEGSHSEEMSRAKDSG
jgi:hypothetical protein